MSDPKAARNVRVVLGLIALAGFVALVVGLLFQERLLAAVAGRTQLNPINVRYIHLVRLGYWLMGAALVAIGLGVGRIGRLREWLGRRPHAVNLLLAGVLVLYPCMMLELALWAHPQLSTVELERRSLSYDRSAFSVHRLSSADQTVLDADLLRRNPIYFLHDGYRGRPFSVRKPPGEIRIFVVGGSYVFDPASYGYDDWPTAVERSLRHLGFGNVRVINAGTPGHRSFDAVGRLHSELWLYDPDYVVLCDTYNDLKYFTWVGPQRTLLQNIEPLPKPTHERVGLLRRLLEHSQLYLRLSRTLVALAGRAGVQVAGDLDKAAPGGGHQEISPFALRQYRLLLATFADICKNAGIVPIFFTEAHLVTAANYGEIERRGLYQTSTLLSPRAMAEAYRACDSVLAEVAREKRAYFFDPGRAVSGVEGNFRDPVHLSPRGSALVAANAAGDLASVLRERGR